MLCVSSRARRSASSSESSYWRCPPAVRRGLGYPKRRSQLRSVLGLTPNSSAAALVLIPLTSPPSRMNRRTVPLFLPTSGPPLGAGLRPCTTFRRLCEQLEASFCPVARCCATRGRVLAQVSGSLAAAELARLDREQRGSRRAARGGPGGHRADRVGGRLAQAQRHDDRVAGPLRGDGGLADELVVPERASDQVEQVGADQCLLLAKKALAGLTHRAHAQLIVEDQEGGGRARQRLLRAAQDHPHPAAPAHALAQLRAPRRVLRRVAAARAESNRLRPTLAGRSPRPVNPNESRHAGRLQHGSRVAARGAQRMHGFGGELGANPPPVIFLRATKETDWR